MTSEGGLGAALVGEKITIGQRNWTVSKLLGEGKYTYCDLSIWIPSWKNKCNGV